MVQQYFKFFQSILFADNPKYTYKYCWRFCLQTVNKYFQILFFSADDQIIFPNIVFFADNQNICKYCFFCRRSRSAEAGVGPPPNIPLPSPAVSTTANTGEIYFGQFIFLTNSRQLQSLRLPFS